MSKRKLKATATIMRPGNKADPPGTEYVVPGDMSLKEADRLVKRRTAKWVVDEAAMMEAAAMVEEASRDKMRAEIEVEMLPKLEAEIRPKIKAELEAELRPKLEKEIQAELEAKAKTNKSAETAGPEKAGGFFDGDRAEAEKAEAGKDAKKGSAKK